MTGQVIESFRSSVGRSNSPVVLDGTLGGGGHSAAMLEAFPKLRVVALEQDIQAIDRTKELLERYGSRISVLHGNFSKISGLIEEDIFFKNEWSSLTGRDEVSFDAVLLDLGISSDQLEDSERGFSFNKCGPLDMRMDQGRQLTAHEVLNGYSPLDLKQVFQRGGVGQFSYILAREIVVSRPIFDTLQFADICKRVMAKQQKTKNVRGAAYKHPATLPFQAVRIEVNGELEVIKVFLKSIQKFIHSGGRLGVISFHSLEDQLVTSVMRKWQSSNLGRNKIPLPVVDGENIVVNLGRMITPKALVPTAAETEVNPRARSARYRVFEFS